MGVAPKSLDAKLAKRFDVRKDNDRRLSRHRFQGLPKRGFSAMMSEMLKGIDVRTNVDYLQCRDQYIARKKLIFTGPIDEFFGFEFGKLAYRGQIRNTEYLPEVDDFQKTPIINYPDPKSVPYVRKIEWKHFMSPDELQENQGTILTTETPTTPTDPSDYEYPFPDDANANLYQQYRKKADQLDDVLICGRLGEYRYFDMDQAIGRAFMLAKREFQLDVPYLDKESTSALPPQ